MHHHSTFWHAILMAHALCAGFGILAMDVYAAVMPPTASAAVSAVSRKVAFPGEGGILIANGEVALPRDCAACAATMINAEAAIYGQARRKWNLPMSHVDRLIPTSFFSVLYPRWRDGKTERWERQAKKWSWHANRGDLLGYSIDADGIAALCTQQYRDHGVKRVCARGDIESVSRSAYDPDGQYTILHGPCILRRFFCDN